MGSGKQRWKISFHKSPISALSLKQHAQIQIQQPFSIPVEFLCPVSNSIMADPVIVSSGHTFERNCVHACVGLSFKPTLPNGAAADFSTVIPNLALKSTILNWCRQHLIDPPKPIDFYSAKNIVCKLIPQLPGTELTRSPSELSVASSDESLTPRNGPTTSSSSCEIENSISNFPEEEQLIAKLKSAQIHEQEEALFKILKSPSKFCRGVGEPLSRETKQGEDRTVRDCPTLIDVLRGGSPESQEHAAGALFSLSLDDQNKTAIGVLGALPPLLHALRSDSDRTRHDSALALYHLSLVQSNRVKMIKLGSVQILLGMLKSGQIPGRTMLILCNLAASIEGRAAMLDGGAVECLVSFMNRGEFDSVATRESCLAAIYGLSYGGLRFKGLAKEAGAEEILKKVVETVSDRAKEKVKRILEIMTENNEEDEEIDWAGLLNSEDDLSQILS
ncbi:hypothetical protein DH2020_012690 [Rehmannia glutinosa]|uniref:RING-type E3 ubiquitin transferase n=1 Tax=Rehmannia glutinosa TaxID=99300 RepID=A0ABR0X0H2_REHGL